MENCYLSYFPFSIRNYHKLMQKRKSEMLPDKFHADNFDNSYEFLVNDPNLGEEDLYKTIAYDGNILALEDGADTDYNDVIVGIEVYPAEVQPQSRASARTC